MVYEVSGIVKLVYHCSPCLSGPRGDESILKSDCFFFSIEQYNSKPQCQVTGDPTTLPATFPLLTNGATRILKRCQFPMGRAWLCCRYQFGGVRTLLQLVCERRVSVSNLILFILSTETQTTNPHPLFFRYYGACKGH